MSKPIEEISTKQIIEMESLTTQLREAMKKTDLRNEKVFEELTRLEEQLVKIRCSRFDQENPRFIR